ncbi:hypothetical protein NBRC116494_15840 [Aurantivibrio plasticivorans]
MSIIDETGIARYETVEKIEQMRALSPLLNAQLDEERYLFAHAEFLMRFSRDKNTVSAVLDFWATTSGIDVIAAYSGNHKVGFIATQVKHDVYYGQEINMAEIVSVYVIGIFRRKGVATKLLSLASTRLSRQGVSLMTISRPIENNVLRNLYKKFGVELVCVHTQKLLTSKYSERSGNDGEIIENKY